MGAGSFSVILASKYLRMLLGKAAGYKPDSLGDQDGARDIFVKFVFQRTSSNLYVAWMSVGKKLPPFFRGSNNECEQQKKVRFLV